MPMVPTFDGEWVEPTVLPAQWPVLLCNGAVGIAEGWPPKCPRITPRGHGSLPGAAENAQYDR